MRPAPQWHQLSGARLARERTLLASLPYFTLERTRFDNGYFKAIGTLHYRGPRSGKEYVLRIRMEYPRTFPRSVPRVFDHDQQFAPGLDGHLFKDHELCLTLLERGEFAAGTEQLTEEMLSATLVWCHKRRLYDRNGTWPGPAERHGVKAVIDLLIEQHVLPDEDTTYEWLGVHATTALGHYRTPDRYAPCPCGSKKPMKFCHEEAFKPLFTRLSRALDTSLLTSALETK